MKDERFFILAGGYDEALYYAKELHIKKDNLRSITEEQDLCGIEGSGKTLLVTQGAPRRERYHVILCKAQERNFKIRFI